MQDCSKLVKARKLLREYEAEKKRRKKKPSPLKLPKPPVKLKKSNKKTSKAYRAEEARLESGLETSTNTSDTEDEEFETCRLSKDILGKASPST
jgi:transposase